MGNRRGFLVLLIVLLGGGMAAAATVAPSLTREQCVAILDAGLELPQQCRDDYPDMIIDNPDPVEGRAVAPRESADCRVRSVLDPVPEGCTYATAEVPSWEVEDLVPWEDEQVPARPDWMAPHGWCDDTISECAIACNDGCAKRGWTVDMVQFRPRPSETERQCACRCADPARSTIAIVCSAEPPRPSPKPSPPTVAH